jgi:LPXTG-motif cell wall-anchored protein
VSTPTVVSNAGGGGPASLPFTGGEVTMLALAGAAALAGGAALVAAGRKRSTV